MEKEVSAVISKEVFMDIVAMHRQGLSMRAIARKLGIHRNTVKRHIDSDTRPRYQKRARKASILDPFRQIIDDYLAEDEYKASWIYDRLKKVGYQGSYETVRDHVRTVKERRGRLAYIRFETELGLQAQVVAADRQRAAPFGLWGVGR